MNCFVLHSGGAALCALTAHWMLIVVGRVLKAQDLGRKVFGTVHDAVLILVLASHF